MSADDRQRLADDRRHGIPGVLLDADVDRRVVHVVLDAFADHERDRIEHGGQHVDERHLGDDAEEQVGRQVGDRTHEQATGAAAMRDVRPRGV